MTEAVLAIDFSLDQLDVGLRVDNDGQLWSHRDYANNWPGFQQLKADLLAELSRHSDVQLTAVGESTGPYWQPAFYHLGHDQELAAYEPSLALLNPLHVKRFRQAQAEQDKTDQLDPALIDRYYRSMGVKHPYQFNDRYLRLRFLTRAYARLTHSLAAEKAYLLSVLFLFASEYQRHKPFSNLFGATSLYVLDETADIQAIADLPLDTLTAHLQAISGNTLPDAQDNAKKLRRVAQHSYPLPDHLATTLHAIVQHTISHIRFLSNNQKAYRRLIEQALDQLPEAQPALALRGLGTILVAGCLSEIQNTERFTSGLKFDRKRNAYRPKTYRDGQASVAKLAGLWWPENASGRFVAQDRRLARERNPYLRYWLVQAAHTLQLYQTDYAAYYRRKFSQARHHQHKRALILTARKAVRLVFALLHKGQRSSLKEAADP
jgi:transposase